MEGNDPVSTEWETVNIHWTTMHWEILWRHRKTARIITIPMIQREESLANGRGERRFMKTIMMQKATEIPSPKRTRSQTLYIRVDNNYYLTDEQGSVRYVLDAAGNVQNDYRYDAFGQRIAGQENIPNRLRYNAQIEDDLTGLYYLRARYYNTGIGRFTQEDVIYNDGLNLYAYCSSNPVMYADPSGDAKKLYRSEWASMIILI